MRLAIFSFSSSRNQIDECRHRNTSDQRRSRIALTRGRAKPLSVAVAGNPNTGKTSLFNVLTGLRQKVANYPGVTVETKMGQWRLAPALRRRA